MTITKKFEKTEEEKIAAKRTRFIIFIALLPVAVLSLLQIWVSHTTANFSGNIERIKLIEKTLTFENKIIENEIAEASSLAKIASESSQLGFLTPKSVEFISSENPAR